MPSIGFILENITGSMNTTRQLSNVMHISTLVVTMFKHVVESLGLILASLLIDMGVAEGNFG